ncbi:MAG: GDSL-type esterase/lipase family protein [Chloroflexota bacterium]
MRQLIMVSILLFWSICGVAIAQSGGEDIRATIPVDVNLREGPGTEYAVIRVVPSAAQVTLLGINEDRSWYFVEFEGVQGWLIYLYIQAEQDTSNLPVVGSDPPPISSTGQVDTVENSQENVQSNGALTRGIISRITSTSHRIFSDGQAQGNRADVFAKVGDSITASDQFLDPIGEGAYALGDYGYLQGVVDYFSRTGARDHFSFANTSVAARSGFTSSDLLNPAAADPALCEAGETPLECEYRLIRPAIALIMIGTNDAGLIDGDTYRTNLRHIVEVSAAHGVIPVLSTIPPKPGFEMQVNEVNAIIRSISASYSVPLWDYHAALAGLHNAGLSEDNVHPSYNHVTGSTAFFTPDGLHYGYNVRNLTALQVLDILWRQVLDAQ